MTPARPELPTLEVHLFDFEEDLYGQPMELEFVAHLDRFERGLAPRIETLRAIQARDSVVTSALDFTLRPTPAPISIADWGIQSAVLSCP